MNWVDRRERYKGEWKGDLQCGYGEHVWIEDRYEAAAATIVTALYAWFVTGVWLAA